MGSKASTRTAGRLGLLAAAAVAVATFAAPEAHARNDFANGFEDQLGRIAAVEVVRAGKFALAAATFHGTVHTAHYRPHPRHHWAAHRDHRARHRDHRARHLDYRARTDRWDSRRDRFRRTDRWDSRRDRFRRAEPCDDDRVVYERVARRTHGDTVVTTRSIRYEDGRRVTERRFWYDD